MSLENRKKVPVGDIENALSALRHRLHYRVKQYGDHGFASIHEILGLISEEFREFEEEVHSDKSELRYKISSELLDIAVGCIWGYLSIAHKTIDW